MEVSKSKVFAHPNRFARTWYWLVSSRELERGKSRAVRILGRDLVVFRTRSGKVRVFDAYCPHMGAHLAEGKVEGEGIRCFFHGWKLDESGCVSDVPCQARTPRAGVRSWPVEERYGLIWIWPGSAPSHPVPFVPELEGKDVVAALGNRFTKNCHPNVVMINAIDEQHFRTVHDLPVEPDFEIAPLLHAAQTFKNRTTFESSRGWGRWLAPFYAGRVTYDLCYWGGTNGTVTVGPDRLHSHILFALRPTDDGGTEGQTILLQPRRRGIFGRLLTWCALRLSAVVGSYFARGDTRVFQTIRFSMETPIAADRSILAFRKFVETQPWVEPGAWEPHRREEDAPLIPLRRAP